MPLREFLRTLLDRRASRAKRISDHRRETFWVPMKRQIPSHKLHLRVVLVAQAIACAAALANLEIWETEPVRERIASLAVIRAKYLEPFRDDARFTNVRQTGTVTAMELETSDAGYLAKLGPKLQSHFHGTRVLLRPLGNTIYVLPPYCVTNEDLQIVYDAIAAAADIV